MSNITLDTLRSLDASKTYYLANSTGQIKEAGAFLLDRFPPNMLYRLNTTLGSKTAAALMRDYTRFASNEFYPEKDWPTPHWDGAEALISNRARNLMVFLDSFKNALDRMLGVGFQYIETEKVENDRFTNADYNVFCDIVMDAKADAQ